MRRLFAALAFALLAAPAPATATSLSVAPTRIELAADARSGSVTLENTGDRTTTVQVETFAWQRGNSIEELEPTRGLLAVPAVFSLNPGERQVIRVATRQPASTSVETAFRLVITEVPVASDDAAIGVRFALRLSLPVFVTPPGAKPAPVWRLAREGGAATLQVDNLGNAHLYVRRLVVRGRGGATQAEVEAPSYVLAGNTQRWPLRLARGAGPLLVEADTNLGSLVVELPD